MSELEVVRSQTHYEAFLHGMTPVRHDSSRFTLRENYYDMPEEGISAVKDYVGSNPDWARDIAWVDLSHRAVVHVKHTKRADVHMYDSDGPYGVFNYPHERLLGQRMLYGDPHLATNRAYSEVELTPLSEILQSGRVSEYTVRWLSSLVMDNSSGMCTFFPKLQHLLPNNLRLR